MFEGSGCGIERDLTSAIYRAAFRGVVAMRLLLYSGGWFPPLSPGDSVPTCVSRLITANGLPRGKYGRRAACAGKCASATNCFAWTSATLVQGS